MARNGNGDSHQDTSTNDQDTIGLPPKRWQGVCIAEIDIAQRLLAISAAEVQDKFVANVAGAINKGVFYLTPDEELVAVTGIRCALQPDYRDNMGPSHPIWWYVRGLIRTSAQVYFYGPTNITEARSVFGRADGKEGQVFTRLALKASRVTFEPRTTAEFTGSNRDWLTLEAHETYLKALESDLPTLRTGTLAKYDPREDPKVHNMNGGNGRTAGT